MATATGSLKTVERTAKKRKTAEAEFRDAVFAAHAAGETLRAIAEAAGLSHTRVLQILRSD